MKLELPLNYEDITIGQILKHGTRELDEIEKVQIYASLSFEEVKKMPIQLVREGAKHIDSILSCPTTKHHKTIKIAGKEYGFIPNWENFTTAEYIDSEQYTKNIELNAHKLMAIMYRPITRKVGDKYEIEEYKGTQHANIFKDVSASYLNGMLVFFWTTRRELAIHSVQSLQSQMKMMSKMKPLKENGDGTTRFSKWLKKTFSRSKN